ncbi:filament polymerization regulator ParJ [Actinocorallia aurea]
MLELDSVPVLDRPVLIAAFEGWNDAGEAASGVIAHLATSWGARQIAEIDPEDYYDFQVTRPRVEGLGDDRKIVWPTTRISVVRLDSGRDVVLLHGIEPNMRWRGFCRELTDYLARLGVRSALLLGALLADAPHTRPVPVSGSGGGPAFGDETLEQSSYEGPTGILGVLQDRLEAGGVETVALWAQVPHYVSSPPNPKATLALLRRVEDLLDVAVPLGELPEQSRAWEEGVNELAEQDSEVADYVRTLEEAKDATELPEATGESIAREFERYLRRRGMEPPV